MMERTPSAGGSSSGSVALGLAAQPRARKAQLDECRLVFDLVDAEASPGVMVDVGAHVGGSFAPFAAAGWRVLAFEPDPVNRGTLLSGIQKTADVKVFPLAVSDVSGREVPFFSSDESSGISSLSAFRASHREIARVSTITLDDIVARERLEEIDFLKIDVEGHELDVLKGLDFSTLKPRAIVVEFEDAKTGPRGYSSKELGNLLLELGYSVYVSEWHPIQKYGVVHSWRQLRCYPCAIPTDSWGNLIALRESPSVAKLERLLEKHVHVKPSADPQARALSREARPAAANSAPRANGARAAANALSRHHPRVALIARHGLRVARFARRFWPVTLIGILAAGGALATAIALAPELLWLWLTLTAVGAAAGAALAAIGYALLTTRRHLRALIDETRQLRATLDNHDSTMRALRRRAAGANQERASVMRRRMKAARRQWREDIDVATREVLDKQTKKEARQAASLAGAERRLRRNARELRDHVAKVAFESSQAVVGLSNAFTALKESVAKLSADSTARDPVIAKLRDNVDNLASAVAAVKSATPRVSNALVARGGVNRVLSDAHLERLTSYWSTSFGLDVSKRSVAYIAHQICLMEDRAQGRLAVPIERAVLRALALRGLKADTIELLEIGTLFGVGAAVLNRCADAAGQTVNLTLLDPLEGYYGSSNLDPLTGLEVGSRLLRQNMETLNVPDSQWRLIRRWSTDPEAVKEASERSYDVLIIDGDHSVAGVANDFELYASMVEPGGLIFFDDYGADDWPAIKPLVDEKFRPLRGWSWIGDEWGMAIMRRDLHARAPGEPARANEKSSAVDSDADLAAVRDASGSWSRVRAGS